MTSIINFTETDLLKLWQSTVGLERETIRIDKNGRVSEMDHPDKWGNRLFHPYLQTDFSESQLELITPPFSYNTEVYDWLSALHQISHTQISQSPFQETLWPYSMPPLLDNLNNIRSAQLDNQKEFDYRQYLISVYGKKVQLLSGIHFNFQIEENLLALKLDQSIKDRVTSRNDVYMNLAKKYLYFRWVLTYLMGATPLFAEDYSSVLYGKPHKKQMKSVRQSRYGYRNKADLRVSFDNFEQYVNDVEEAVHCGLLNFEKELYRDVRMRGAKPNRRMLTEGISYLEFRNFDLNPFHSFGISLEDLDFIKLWIISLLIHPQTIDENEIDLANVRNQYTAESDPFDDLIDQERFTAFSQTLLRAAEIIDSHYYSKAYLSKIVENKLGQIQNPKLTLSGQISHRYQNFSQLSEDLLQLSHSFQNQAKNKNYLLHGFEDLELSTQAVIKTAIEKGILVNMIDRQDNLIELQHDSHSELIKSANMTSLDSQVSYFLMDNKSATKKLLERAGIDTPKGEKFYSLDQALRYYSMTDLSASVIKPQNTNYGLGITIFNHTPSKDEFKTAVKEAFKHDQTVLIEEFIEGIELRFYVQDQKVLAICERQPAHVIGDGEHTIDELIDLENQHPYRGPRHLAPLTLIEKGEIERLTLNEQNYSLESIPKKGQQVFLRKNSNISSGGIAIDRTDQVHPDFIAIAEKAAAAMRTTFCGVDIIIKDYQKPVSKNNGYSVLETNYNPMMSLHLFPAKGKARPLTINALDRLFPELVSFL